MTDRFVVRAVVCFLGIATLVGIGGLIWLIATADNGTTAGTRDAAMLAVVAGPTGTALGALATLLARTGSETSSSVQVDNAGEVNVPSEPASA